MKSIVHNKQAYYERILMMMVVVMVVVVVVVVLVVVVVVMVMVMIFGLFHLRNSLSTTT